MFLEVLSAQDQLNLASNLEKYFSVFSAGANAYLIGIVYAIVPIVAYWYLFEKKGEPGWKILIPLYGSYMQFKLFFKTSKFWRQFAALVLIFASFIVLFIGVVMAEGTGNSGLSIIIILSGFALMLIFSIWAIVISIQYDISICKKYGRGFWFTLGMIFMTPLFIGILAYEVHKGRAVEID